MLMAITWPQTVSSLERQYPPWIFRGKSADLIQLPKLVLGECEFNRCEIVLKLVETFRANNDRGYHRAGRQLSHLVPEIYGARPTLFRIRWCQRACRRPAQMDSNRQLGIREGHKAAKGINGLYPCTHSLARPKARKRTIMNRSVQWTHLLFYTVSGRNRSVL
jgi:hypothetical protein